MSNDELYAELINHTGESPKTLACMGFSILSTDDSWLDSDDLEPHVIDWDSAERQLCPLSSLSR